MATQTDIINLALYKIAQSNTIPTMLDESKAGDVMRRLWQPMRDLVLSARNWPWAMKSEALATSLETPQIGWGYRYAYPSDCMTAIALTNEGGIRASRQYGGMSAFCDAVACRNYGIAFDFELSYGEQETTINADIPAAYLVYTVQVIDTGRYPPDFVAALACRLAAEAAPPMIGEAGLNAKKDFLAEYADALSNASAHGRSQGSDQSQQYVTATVASREGY